MPTYPVAVSIPLLNPNEPEARLVSLYVEQGEHVSSGQVLATLETTKSAVDVAAETSGYIAGLRHGAGDTVMAGEVLCYLAETADWIPPIAQPTTNTTVSDADSIHLTLPEIPPGVRISQPALALASQAGLDMSALPKDRFITENLVRSLLVGSTAQQESTHLDARFDPAAIVVYGAGGHGKSLLDMLHILGTYRVVGFLDDGLKPGEIVMDTPVLGGKEALSELYQQGVRLVVNAVGGIGNIRVRIEVFQKLATAGFGFPILIHPSAFVEPSATLSPGVQVLPHAYIGSQAKIGFGAIVNTGSIVSHDCELDDYVNLSPGAILAGEVHIGAAALIGMGVTVNLGVKIGSGARIGNGATVKNDVPEKGLVRAGAIWPAD